ncbi:11323_t:CDS:2, partial [Rhizophagus irregularis]
MINDCSLAGNLLKPKQYNHKLKRSNTSYDVRQKYNRLVFDSSALLHRQYLLELLRACNEDYNWFTGDQKSRLLKLIPDCDLLDDIVDTPRIEREYMA